MKKMTATAIMRATSKAIISAKSKCDNAQDWCFKSWKAGVTQAELVTQMLSETNTPYKSRSSAEKDVCNHWPVMVKNGAGKGPRKTVVAMAVVGYKAIKKRLNGRTKDYVIALAKEAGLKPSDLK